MKIKLCMNASLNPIAIKIARNIAREGNIIGSPNFLKDIVMKGLNKRIEICIGINFDRTKHCN